MTSEFPRPHRLDQIGAGETAVEIEATPEECAALARRFDLVGIDRLAARFALRRDAIGILATGHLSSAVTQSCGVTGDPLPATIDEDFAIRFLPEPEGEESHDDVELDEEEMDTVFYIGSVLDLGEAAAETLALALDPFPRSPNAAEVLRQAGVISDEDAGPLSPLAAALKGKLGKD
ncbi:YceD family protein [Sphingomonas sp. DG1-23]|uniref:YceD family protein n=1 Tax=Sphingomonas sp. DG1-23 TaxID=3068316 RepID=UPI00273FCDB4|nr:YceD family protein [Sphingomonas sp. DG1-23]MDP5281331.1 YceD family protein [Sphingomonas sp. DG1-23]